MFYKVNYQIAGFKFLNSGERKCIFYKQLQNFKPPNTNYFTKLFPALGCDFLKSIALSQFTFKS